MAIRIKVLLLKCEYDGAYSSFKQFYDNIKNMFMKSNVDVIIASTLDEAMSLLSKKNINFTINLGRYPYYYKNIALYDFFKILNYQWIIDNPLRYPICDMNSRYNRMIYIDKNFVLYPNCYKREFLHMSLPYPDYKFYKDISNINAVLAPMKIKSISEFERRINKSIDKEILESFINEINLDDSFNRLMCKYISRYEISNLRDFFEIANGYIRTKKRIIMLNAIKKHKVFVLSNKPDSIHFNNNIAFWGERNYIDYLNIQKNFNLILNCNPNFDMCIHDRVSSSIMNGKIVVSDANEILTQIKMPMCFQYSKIYRIDDMLEKAQHNFKSIQYKQVKCLKNNFMPNADLILKNYFSFLDKHTKNCNLLFI